ncbi:MAG: cyclase family protein [Saprospiraceae bacterium]|nr:cyclase family protein [Saprospiraceae bacterium]
MFDPSDYIIHDLTLPYDERIAGFSSEEARTVEEHGWNAMWLKIYSHAGTHMDAPLHFEVEQTSIDVIPPNRFIGRAWVVDVEVASNGHLIEVEALTPYDSRIVAGDNLILRTGWCSKLGTDQYRDQLPRISEEVAYWMVDKKINMVLVEPPSVADVNDLPEVTLIHHILMQGDVLIVEGICNLANIKSEWVTILAVPLSIKGCDGAPARVLAFESKKGTS